MRHLFKVQSGDVDIFISSINKETTEIEYQVYDKVKSVTVKESTLVQYKVGEDKNIYFDQVGLPINLFDHIYSIISET